MLWNRLFYESIWFTNYHVITPDIIKNEIIEIEIWNQKRMKLNVLNRKIRFFEKPRDITIIEIYEFDEIYKDIDFLDYDKNYEKGYQIYKNIDVFSIQYPFGKGALVSNGIIIHDLIKNEGNIVKTIKENGG